ncbi:MAG TPA: hypothetical protein VJ739_15265 [Gemmataceae bacterium]|nr:hypothetical protein [Gemmataceae bacterium]
MIAGTVNARGEPAILMSVADQLWEAVIDTGFSGDLELPDSLRPSVNARFNGRVRSVLAAGQSIVEDSYIVDFPFDGHTVQAEATFAPVNQILIGTHLLRRYRLEVDFVARTVLLTRVAPSPP